MPTHNLWQQLQYRDRTVRVKVYLGAGEGDEGPYVLVDDIQDHFSDATTFTCGGDLVSFMRDTGGKRLLPLRFGYLPDKVVTAEPTTSPQNLTRQNTIVLQSTTALEIEKDMFRQSSTHFENYVRAMENSQNEQAHRLQLSFQQGFSELHAALDRNHDLQKQLYEMQQLMLQMQQQALDRLARLLGRVEALLTTTYELHEYPIPRLFVILPQDSSRWDILKPFTHKFRLYFLCECGEHTASINSKTLHHIHLARHGGYEISRPTEFLQQYGPYILTILKMLKFGISVAGVAVPAISHLIKADIVDEATADLQRLADNIAPGMDKIISYLEKASLDEGEAVVDRVVKEGVVKEEAIKAVMEQIENKEALEGADLRKLDTFLKDKDGSKALGNLYRTLTDKGHVKWVCIDHYREQYQEKAVKAFQDTVYSLGGSFNENLGQVEVTVRSKVMADQFYSALNKAKSVHDIKIQLAWETSYNDLKTLRDTLLQTNVAILAIGCANRVGPAADIWNRGQRYNPIFQIMRHPSIRSFEILDVSNLFTQSSLWPSNADLFHLKHLSIGATTKNDRFGSPSDADISKLRSLIAQASNLTNLSLKIGWSPALFETFRINSTLTTFDLKNNSIGDNGAIELAYALKINSIMTTLSLEGNSIGDSGAVALAEALKTNSTLTTLDLRNNLICIKGVLSLSVALNTSLTTVDIRNNKIGDDEAKALIEAFRTNSALTTLNLFSNEIGSDGAVVLADALKTNLTLVTLNLQFNQIKDYGAVALADSLKTNSNLTTLSLQNNQIKIDGAKALAEALKTNLTLTTLNLFSNEIGSGGAMALADALKTNSTLVTLNLQFNRIKDDGAVALADALKTNSTLTNLYLQFNQIEIDGAVALADAVKAGSALTALNLQNNLIESMH